MASPTGTRPPALKGLNDPRSTGSAPPTKRALDPHALRGTKT
jgi:hypothetical protein